MLITRKHKRVPFDVPSNVRIVCNLKMGLIILSYLHLMGAHIGSNQLVRLFNLSFKMLNAYATARLITTSCRACQLYRTTTRNNLPVQRIPFPPHSAHTWSYDHMFFGQGIKHKGKHLMGCLNLVDNYSSLLVSYMVGDTGVKTTLECLKQCFSIMSPPKVLVSDNASSLNANMAIANFLKSIGVSFHRPY